MRLLKLPPSIRKFVESGELTQGHARALLAVDDPIQSADLARRAVTQGWSVREVERRVARAAGKRRGKAERARDPVVLALEESLQDYLQTKVQVKSARSGKGSVEISFHNPDDFGRLFELLTGKTVAEVVE